MVGDRSIIGVATAEFAEVWGQGLTNGFGQPQGLSLQLMLIGNVGTGLDPVQRTLYEVNLLLFAPPWRDTHVEIKEI